MGALDSLAADRTTLMIAHRLATVVNADQIVVMRHGQVIEQGTHRQLVAADGTLIDGNLPDPARTDFHISDMQIDAKEPAVVYNGSADNQYLVVWSGETSATIDGKYDIYGQLVAADGTLINAAGPMAYPTRAPAKP